MLKLLPHLVALRLDLLQWVGSTINLIVLWFNQKLMCCLELCCGFFLPVQTFFKSANLIFKVFPLFCCCLKLLLAQGIFIVELCFLKLRLLQLFDLLLNLLQISLSLLFTKFLNCQLELMLTSCQLFCFCEHFLAAQLKLFFLALYFFDCIWLVFDLRLKCCVVFFLRLVFLQ